MKKGKAMTPWKQIALADDSSHMQLEEVKQLQTLAGIMKDRIAQYPGHL